MTKEEKGKYFYILTKMIKANSGEDIPVESYSELKEEYEPELKNIADQINNLPEEDRVKLDEEFAGLEPEEQQLYVDKFIDDEALQTAKNGARLNFLKSVGSLKKGGRLPAKKCSCGCELVAHKEKGGKVTMKCACGCSANKQNNIVDALTKVKSMKDKMK